MDGKQNPWMEPGDIVSVLEVEEAFVVGKVFKPAKVSLKEPLTLTQAIASAGGLDPNANTDRVVIQRQAQGSAVKTELVYNLKDIKDKKVPDPFLQANDIVEVSNDKVKSVKSGLIKALTGGIPNIFYRVPLP
jgi:protein involved in polysaccharide export with SLBB domain